MHSALSLFPFCHVLFSGAVLPACLQGVLHTHVLVLQPVECEAAAGGHGAGHPVVTVVNLDVSVC